MGFMDKARQLAEQAQQKLDEQQTKFAESSPPPPPAPPAASGPPAPAPSAMPTSAEDAERIAPPTITSGDPLKRP